MLYNLQPDRSVTGGAWYSDQDFESEFVEVLNQQCFKFLQSKVQEHASAEQGEHGGLHHHHSLISIVIHNQSVTWWYLIDFLLYMRTRAAAV